MAFALSVDAQEFVPGIGFVGSSSKAKLCSSLSVDAPVFVPVVSDCGSPTEISASAPLGNQNNKPLVAQRRGRFAQIDSRAQSNQKNVDVFKPPTQQMRKENSNTERTLKVQTNGNLIESRISKDAVAKKKLKQSFSLEYSKRRQQQTSVSLEENLLSDTILDNDVESVNKGQQSLCFSSGESKPIILWSSIVKQEPSKDEKKAVATANQEKNVRNNTVPDEKPSKKYSKNKVTRTKNVLSESANEKFQRNLSERKRKDFKKDEEKVTKPSIEVTNTKIPDHDFTENAVSNNPNQKLATASKNLKRKSKDKILKSGMNVSEKITSSLVCDSTQNKFKREGSSNILNSKTQKMKDAKKNIKKPNGDQFENKLTNIDIVKKKKNQENPMSCVRDKPNNAEKNLSLNDGDYISANLLPDEVKREVVDLNLSDNTTFPALSMGKMTTSVQPFSYSAVTKRVLPVNKVPVGSSATLASSASQNILDALNNMKLTEEEKKALRKRQKALKRKMKVKQKKQEAKLANPTKQSSVKTEKASDKEMTFDLSDMFTKLLKIPAENKSQKAIKAKKMKVSTGVISVVSGLAKKNTPDGRRVERNKYGTTHTIMDGTTIRKRGKERETPKRKRPTLLKKVITAERERKRVLQEGKSTDIDSKDIPLTEECLMGPENFNVEKVEYISELPENVWKKIHSKKFREYCDHVLTKDINNLTYNLLVTLQKFQDRVYHENRTKYKQKRRFILGLREVLKHLKLKRLKAVIIAPNIERISAKGGLDDYLGSIISICNEQGIPKIFAMNRHVLGRVIKKLAPVSVVGIFDYDGAHEIFKELINLVQLAKATYMEKVSSLLDDNLSTEQVDASESNNIFQNTLDSNLQQFDRGTNEIKHHILSKLYLDEYRNYEVESESDWVTDNESAPL